MAKKRKVVWAGRTPITPITAKERKQIAEQIQRERERLRKIYPEAHGKVVDFEEQLFPNVPKLEGCGRIPEKESQFVQ